MLFCWVAKHHKTVIDYFPIIAHHVIFLTQPPQPIWTTATFWQRFPFPKLQECVHAFILIQLIKRPGQRQLFLEQLNQFC